MSSYPEGVSICITAYKSKKFIKECLDSIATQTWFESHDNWEVLIGVDNCQETLDYLLTILPLYKNTRVFMMRKNYGTYVTSNTLMKLAKYNGLIRFDSDDTMCCDMVEKIMEQKGNADWLQFKLKNFGANHIIAVACGQIYIKHSVFDKYGGYRPWVCSADKEMEVRLFKTGKIFHKTINQILLNRRVHHNNLTVAKETSYTSPLRREYNKQIMKIVIKKPEDAIIECVTGEYDEIEIPTNIDISKLPPIKPPVESYALKPTNKDRREKPLLRTNKSIRTFLEM